VDHFKNNEDRYKKSSYNETMVRNEFINKFFECLGWDVTNNRGVQDEFKDVEMEYSVKTHTGAKRPDYAFNMGGVVQFFVEAKKPSENISKSKRHATQLKRYAFNKKIPISILTDFEELAVYDCRRRPKDGESVRLGRKQYFRYEEYVEKFDVMWDLFSKESVSRGSLGRYIRIDRGTELVNSAFLSDMKEWRKQLSREMFASNGWLTDDELNFCVQKVMDRVLFLRICEDRGIEESGQLKQKTKKPGIYKSLIDLFQASNDKYNSGLFNFDIDSVTTTIKIKDGVLKKIIEQLYPPTSPYDFSVLSIEILGQAYEEFLGQVIQITGNGTVIIKDKPEVKSAGGVFYTPSFVVSYIVKNTVRKSLEKKSPEQIAELKIIDPACGSGAFLVGAFSELLDYHLSYYKKKYRVDEGGKKQQKNREIYNVGERWYLTAEIKKRILLNNIYGLDRDSYAVEITKLSLLLKVLENESEEKIAKQLTLFHEKALPDLDNNILCGNTLVSYNIRQKFQLSDKDIRDLRPFEWNDTGHKLGRIFEGGGFDMVIGNPPYIAVRKLPKIQRKYFADTYDTPSKTYDIYYLFLEVGMKLLSKKGQMSFILPHKFFTGESGRELRCFMGRRGAVKEVIHFGTNQVFEKSSTTYTCILTLSCKKNQKFDYGRFETDGNIWNLSALEKRTVNSNTLGCDDWTFSSKQTLKILDKVRRQSKRFGDITHGIFKGSSTGDDKIFVLDRVKTKNKRIMIVHSSKTGEDFEIESDLLHPFVHGEDVRAFVPNDTEKFLLVPYQGILTDTIDGKTNTNWRIVPEAMMKSKFPKAAKYLQSVKTDLKKRASHRSNETLPYYSYSASRNLQSYENKKIMIPDMLVSNRIAMDAAGGTYHNANVHGAVFNDKADGNFYFYLGVLNSNLFWFFIKSIGTALRGDAYRLMPQFLNKFCFPEITAKNHGTHDKIAKNTESVCKLLLKKRSVRLDADRRQIDAEIWRLRHDNDCLTNRMYGIVKSEAGILAS